MGFNDPSPRLRGEGQGEGVILSAAKNLVSDQKREAGEKRKGEMEAEPTFLKAFKPGL
jgi:hypothetical protein